MSVLVGGANVSVWSEYILRKLVPGLKANLFFADYAEPALLPANAGAYVARWNVPTMRTGSVTALTDGTSGGATTMVTLTGVVGTISDYGEWMNIGDLANETDIPTALDGYKDIVQYAGAAAIDTLIYNQAVTTTNYMHSQEGGTGGVTLDSGQTLRADDIAVISSFFRGNNAQGFDSLKGDYMFAIHPDQEFDLVTDVTNTRLSWVDVNKHVPAGFEQLVDNHRFVGRLNGVSVLRTTIIGTVTEDIAAFQSVALARHGVGWLGLGSSGPKAPMIKMKSPGPTSTNDPLDTNHTLGWKFRAAARLLDANRAFIVYSDAA